MDYLNKIKEAAEEALKENDGNVAIVLYCLLGLKKSGMLSLLAEICQSISRWDLERLNAEQSYNNYRNN